MALPTPETREETFMAAAAGEDVNLPTPITRREIFLNAIAENAGGGGGGGSGEDGGYYTPSVSVEGVLSWTPSKSGMPSVADANVKGPQGATGATGPQGPQGEPGVNGTNGADGTDGTTFTPFVSSAGVISWTNDGGKQNPASVDLVAAVIAALPTWTGGSY